MNKSETIGALAKALSAAQSTMKSASKDSVNPFFKSRYADFQSIWEAAREPITKNGLAIVQSVSVKEGGGSVLTTFLLHSSGEWISGEYPIQPVKSDPQSFGSAVTYAKRYSLAAIVGIVAGEEDDDGNAASRSPVYNQNNIQEPSQLKKQAPKVPVPAKTASQKPDKMFDLILKINSLPGAARSMFLNEFKVLDTRDLLEADHDKILSLYDKVTSPELNGMTMASKLEHIKKGIHKKIEHIDDEEIPF
jgi:hypothetical protein